MFKSLLRTFLAPIVITNFKTSSCFLGSFLDKSLDSKALNIEVCHCGISSSCTCVSKHYSSLSTILVVDNLDGVLLDIVSKHLGTILKTVVDCTIANKTTSSCIYQICHSSRFLVVSGKTCTGCGFVGKIGGKGFGKFSLSTGNKSADFDSGGGGGLGNVDGAPGKGSNLGILFGL